MLGLRSISTGIAIGALVVSAWGCSTDEVDSEEDARLAYMGLDNAIERAINLGLDGYNAASSANIPDQNAEGDIDGTITISGQVDQGTSNNKGLRLWITLDDYVDPLTDDEDEEIEVRYTTFEEDLPYLEIKLRDLPDGTFTGTLTGTFAMTGALEGDVDLDLQFAGDIEAVPETEDDIRRVDGTTTITGTATSQYGTYDVELVR